ncbi:fimbrial protein [Serratia oryzae]|uniref:Uncharacterized protein n=1 Tax=Serratia oryzae TaxID=2034155 RepID=A0A1S8CIU4_9GAMM|nr:fimbrial protein [Serratia oryzae]OMQ21777.1 hypothetical protein BMI79_13780 [Serratia oryzae]
MKNTTGIKPLVLCLSLALFAVIGSTPAFAVCGFLDGHSLQVHQLTISPISLARDTAIGTVVGNGETLAANGPNYAWCNSTTFYRYQMNASNGMTVNGLNNVFPTNIPGIGLRFYGRSEGSAKSYQFNNQGTGGGTVGGGGWRWGSNGLNYWGVDVVVTGPVSSGIYSSNLVASLTIDTLLVFNVSVNPFTVTGSSCDASSTQQVVDFGRQPLSAFTGLGSTTPAKNFSIELRGCSATKLNTISYTLSASNGNVVGLPTGVIANYNGSSLIGVLKPAAGIGVKVMDSLGNPVTFGSKKTVSFTPGTSSISIPFKASMYQYGNPTVSVGTVYANMFFTMEYK